MGERGSLLYAQGSHLESGLIYPRGFGSCTTRTWTAKMSTGDVHKYMVCNGGMCWRGWWLFGMLLGPYSSSNSSSNSSSGGGSGGM